MSKTYFSRDEFLAEVNVPFNARMKESPVRIVRGIYADDDTVVVLFDLHALARDGHPYNNTYAWFLKMRDERVYEVVAFFDTRTFDEFWSRAIPKL